MFWRWSVCHQVEDLFSLRWHRLLAASFETTATSAQTEPEQLQSVSHFAELLTLPMIRNRVQRAPDFEAGGINVETCFEQQIRSFSL